MPYTHDYLVKLAMDEALKLVLMDVYTADQYSIEKRDAVIDTAISQIKGLFKHESEQGKKINNISQRP